MIIFRKNFSSMVPQVGEGNGKLTSRDLQLEQGRLQRQLLITQRMRQKLQADEKRSRLNRIVQLQKMEQRKDIEEDKQLVRVKKLEEDKEAEANTTLYKSKSKPVAPVPMK